MTTKTSKFHPLYFPICQRCHACQKPKIASATQILKDQHGTRTIHFCCDCATDQGQPPAKELLSRIEAMEKPTHCSGKSKSTSAKARAKR